MQVRRAPGNVPACICDLMTGRNQYGLGPGVYPKAVAPRPPFHPFCRCVLSPRLDLTGRKAGNKDEAADRYFLDRIGEPLAGRVMGSQARRDRVLRGEPADAVINSTREQPYKLRTVGG